MGFSHKNGAIILFSMIFSSNAVGLDSFGQCGVSEINDSCANPTFFSLSLENQAEGTSGHSGNIIFPLNQSWSFE